MKAQGNEIGFRGLLPWFLLALLITLGPYLVAWLATPADKFFVGTLANHNDYSAYLAAMQQGAEGQLLFRLNFSPEAWQPVLMLPTYMVAGRLLGWLGLSYPLLFNVLRVLAVLFTLSAFVVWVRAVFPHNRRYQLTAWLLIVFGGGLGWLLWPLLGSSLPFDYFPDLAKSEWNLVLVSANAPHYTFGLGLETLLFVAVLRMLRGRGSVRWALISLALALLLGLTYVYHIAVAGAILGVCLLHVAWQGRAIPWRHWLLGALVLAPLAPLLYYYSVFLNRDPLWAAYVQSDYNRIPAPPPLGLAIGLGLLGLLAIVGLIAWLRDEQEPLVPIWWLTTLALMYLPIVQYSERFALGLTVPTGTLAAFGLERKLLPWLRETGVVDRLARLSPTPAETARRVVLLLTVPSVILASLLLAQNAVVHDDFPNYMPVAELEAMEWLAGHTAPDDVVLAYYPAGNFLPAVSDSRVYVGQFFLTPQFDDKLALAEKFWSPETSAAWRRQFLERAQIDYVYHGTYEEALADGENVDIPAPIVHRNETVTIYSVTE